MEQDAERVIKAISSVRLTGVWQEIDIHRLIENALIKSDIEFTHEARLGKGRRVDFMVNRTAIEIKKNKPSPAALEKQLSSYLECESVDEVVVVTKRTVKLKPFLNGKKVHSVSLDRLWGISLP